MFAKRDFNELVDIISFTFHHGSSWLNYWSIWIYYFWYNKLGFKDLLPRIGKPVIITPNGQIKFYIWIVENEYYLTFVSVQYSLQITMELKITKVQIKSSLWGTRWKYLYTKFN